MHKISFKDPHRQKHFDFFNQMDQPHFSLTANVDITEFLKTIRAKNIPFTPAMVYLVSRAANEIKTFRWRIRDGEIFEHTAVHPSFSVLTEVSDVFSFCYVDYQNNAAGFIEATQKAILRMQKNPSFEDEAGRDDYLFMSSMPWVSFTNINHAMHYSPVDSVPRIVWGKYFEQQNKTLMPLSVQAHHALVDGQDVGKYFQGIQKLFDESAVVFRQFTINK